MKQEICTRNDGHWYLYPPVKLDLDWKERLIREKADYWKVPYWQIESIIAGGLYPFFVELCIGWSKLKLLEK